ncbi:MAG: DUF4412 domain-containing protein [Bacteroidia bacterium]|nr:DUF4412 domain-containing protein [Bacteroidia bacterium]
MRSSINTLVKVTERSVTFSLVFALIVLFSLSANSLFAQSYEGSFTLNIQEYHNGHTHDHDKNSIDYSFYNDQIAMLVKSGTNPASRMILDHKNKTMIALSDQGGQKQGFKMKMSDELYAMAKANYDKEAKETHDKTKGTWTVTGREKVIEGMNCYEVKFSDDKTQGTMWLTSEMKLKFASLMGLMHAGPNSRKGSDQYDNFYHNDFPMEINEMNPQGAQVSKIWITNVSEEVDKKNFSTDGYNVQDMSNFDMHNLQQHQNK